MKNGRLLILVIGLFVSSVNYGQETEITKGLQTITPDAIKAQLGFLASDWMEGREAGEKGEYLASDYIASMLQLYGVKPAGDPIVVRSSGAALKERSYFQNFVILRTTQGKNQSLQLKEHNGNTTRVIDFVNNVDFILNPVSYPVETEFPVVFVGYGFRNDKIRYNDFIKSDLKGKLVLKITGYPAFAQELLTLSEINQSIINSERLIRESGATGIIEFNPSKLVSGSPLKRDFLNNSSSEKNSLSAGFDARYSLPGTRIPSEFYRVSLSARAAEEILKGTGISTDEYLKKADTNSQLPPLPAISKTICLKSDVTITQIPVRNIIGVVEGENSDQVIVVGAHYDHMGINNGIVWNGADDNGSGTVGVMSLARAITATGIKPKKTIIFALWTAEEKGLLGSRYFVKNTSYPVNNIKLNLNFDMIGRYISDTQKNGVVMTYSSSQKHFRELTENNLKKFNIDLDIDFQPSDDPPGGTDHRSFVEAGVPVMRFKPGHREEYHTPYDETSTIDWDIMEKIIRISFANLWILANTSW
jgi:hypothetical protein